MLQRILVTVPDPDHPEQAQEMHQAWASATEGHSDLLVVVSPTSPQLEAFREAFDELAYSQTTVDGVKLLVGTTEDLRARFVGYRHLTWWPREPIPDVLL